MQRYIFLFQDQGEREDFEATVLFHAPEFCLSLSLDFAPALSASQASLHEKISPSFLKKISNVFRKISNVFWNRSEFFSLTAPLSLPCQLRVTTSAAYFTMSSSLFLHVECVVHALLFGEEIAAVVVVGLDFHRHIFHNLKAIGF